MFMLSSIPQLLQAFLSKNRTVPQIGEIKSLCRFAASKKGRTTTSFTSSSVRLRWNLRLLRADLPRPGGFFYLCSHRKVADAKREAPSQSRDSRFSSAGFLLNSSRHRFRFPTTAGRRSTSLCTSMFVNAWRCVIIHSWNNPPTRDFPRNTEKYFSDVIITNI